MSIAEDVLVDRLRENVPARDSVPSDMQYEQAIRDAIADYSTRAPLRKIVTLSIVSGQADYTLPADFLYVIRFASLLTREHLLNTAGGLIPVSTGYEERYTIAGLTLTIIPTPNYAATRELEYSAGYVASVDGDAITYDAITATDAARIMLKAQAIALIWQANAQARYAMSHQIGDERVNKEKIAAELRAQALLLDVQYDRAIQQRTGTIGMRADYPELDAETW